MTTNYIGAIGLTGGSTGDLDNIDGSILSDNDCAFVVTTDQEIYFFVLDDDSAETEASPIYIAPDTNPGPDKRWVLNKIMANGAKFHDAKVELDADGDASIQASSSGSVITFETGGANQIVFNNSAVQLKAHTLWTDIDGDTGITSASGDDTLDIYIGGALDFELSANTFAASSGSLIVSEVFKVLEKSADPSAPLEGQAIIWMSDGTGKGDDGDVMIASTAGGTTKYGTLFDHSAGSAWS